jgi:hypothetical protein
MDERRPQLVVELALGGLRAEHHHRRRLIARLHKARQPTAPNSLSQPALGTLDEATAQELKIPSADSRARQSSTFADVAGAWAGLGSYLWLK